MLRTLPLAILLLAALLAAAMPASAHVEGFSQARTLNVGPYLVYLQPQPDTIFANTTLTMSAQLAHSSTGASAKGAGVTLHVRGPNEFNRTMSLRDDGRGMLVGSVLLPARGNYTFGVEIKDANGTYRDDTWLEAYPDLPIRIRSSDAEQDVYVGREATLEFNVVNRTTLRPVDNLTDLTLRLEHWDDAHTRLISEREVPLSTEGGGRWRITTTFDAAGMYHMQFASKAGGFTYSDVPILHTYATLPLDEGLDQGQDRNPAPGPGLALLAAGLVAGATLLRRRAR